MKKHPIFIITFLGLLLRFVFLFHHDPWFDEAISILISRLPVKELIGVASYDNNPPLYYLILHLWMKISQNPIWLRSLSLLFSTVTIPLTYKLAKSLTNRSVAITASLLTAIMPVQLYYAGEIRSYSLLIMESTLLFYLCLKRNRAEKEGYLSSKRLMARQPSWLVLAKVARGGYQLTQRTQAWLKAKLTPQNKRPSYSNNRSEQVNLIPDLSAIPDLSSATIAIVSAALLLTHYYGLVVLLAATALILKKPQREKRLWIKSAIYGFVLTLPWFFLTIGKPHPFPWSPPPLLSIAFMPIAATTGLVGITPPSTLPLLYPPMRATIVLVALLFLWLLLKGLENPKAKIITLIVLIATFIVAIFTSAISPRVILPFASLLYILVAKTLVQRPLLKPIFVAAVLASVLALFSPPLRGTPLRSIADILKKRSQTTLHTAISTYYPTILLAPNVSNLYVGPPALPKPMTQVIGGTPSLQSLPQTPQMLLVIDEKNTDIKTKNAIKEQLYTSYELTDTKKLDSVTIQVYKQNEPQ